jgi:hypothetical protein
MAAALNLRLARMLPWRSIQRLVVPLLGCNDGGKIMRLLPVWRTAAANPRMGSGNRTSEDGGKACGSNCKAVVPGHGRILPPKKKNAMRKNNPCKVLRNAYSLRMSNTNHIATIAFFAATDAKTKTEILAAIAKHYGISESEALEEVTDEEAESLLDYLTGSIRTATSLLMKRHGIAA